MPFFLELRRSVPVAALVATFVAVATPAHGKTITGRGTWEDTLQLRDINGDGIIDAFYDTSLDITWLAGVRGGLESWSEAKAWAEGLNVHGVKGWRLPDVKPVDGVGFNYTFRWDGSTDVGYHITSSELGHMFYVTLGNKAPGDDPASIIDGLVQQGSDYGMFNSGPFGELPRNVVPYWTGVESTQNPDKAWYFDGDSGYQGVTDKSSEYTAMGFYLWAVHEGDVPHVNSGVIPTVPEPETLAMMLAGLSALVVARKRKA